MILEWDRDHPHADEPAPATRLGAGGDRSQWPGLPDRPAAALLRSADDVERRVLAANAGASAADGLRPVRWEDVARRVYVDRWADAANDGARGSITDLPALALARDADRDALAAAFATALHRDGWRLVVIPGCEPVAQREDGARLEPWAIVAELGEGGVASARRLQEFAALGIADLPLTQPREARPPDVPPPSAASALQGRVRLPVARGVRVMRLLGLLIVGTLAMPVGGMSVAAAFMSDLMPGARVVMLVIGLGMLAGFGTFAWRRRAWSTVPRRWRSTATR